MWHVPSSPFWGHACICFRWHAHACRLASLSPQAMPTFTTCRPLQRDGQTPGGPGVAGGRPVQHCGCCMLPLVSGCTCRQAAAQLAGIGRCAATDGASRGVAVDASLLPPAGMCRVLMHDLWGEMPAAATAAAGAATSAAATGSHAAAAAVANYQQLICAAGCHAGISLSATFPNLRRWVDRIKPRPAVQRGLNVPDANPILSHSGAVCHTDWPDRVHRTWSSLHQVACPTVPCTCI